MTEIDLTGCQTHLTTFNLSWMKGPCLVIIEGITVWSYGQLKISDVLINIIFDVSLQYYLLWPSFEHYDTVLYQIYQQNLLPKLTFESNTTMMTYLPIINYCL